MGAGCRAGGAAEGAPGHGAGAGGPWRAADGRRSGAPALTRALEQLLLTFVESSACFRVEGVVHVVDRLGGPTLGAAS
jgi:hypothetical protein